MFAQVGFVALDSCLGEYDVMTKVGEINFISKDMMSDNAKPISQLTFSFDNFN